MYKIIKEKEVKVLAGSLDLGIMFTNALGDLLVVSNPNLEHLTVTPRDKGDARSAMFVYNMTSNSFGYIDVRTEVSVEVVRPLEVKLTYEK